jgi:hypothetical protein
MRLTRAQGFLLALAMGLLPGRASSQPVSVGPLTWEEGSPFQRLALTPSFERADPQDPGTVSADLWLGYANIFEQDSTDTHVLFLDTERLLTAVTIRWGVGSRLEVGGRMTVETTGGGMLDGFVQGYHELLGFGQANRDRFPQGGYAQHLYDGGPEALLDIPRRTLALEDVQLHAKWGVARSADGRGALALRAVLRAPVAANVRGEERADAALVALGRLGAGAWYVHGLLSAAAVRASPELRTTVRDMSFSLGLAVERALGARVAAVAQYQVASPVLRGFDHRELDWPSSNLVLGLAGRWGGGWSWDASFQEDLPADTPAIDFTVGLRISRAW